MVVVVEKEVMSEDAVAVSVMLKYEVSTTVL